MEQFELQNNQSMRRLLTIKYTCEVVMKLSVFVAILIVAYFHFIDSCVTETLLCLNSTCKGHTFETVINSPINSSFKMNFIQCATCGTVVGVTEFFNIVSLIERLADKMHIKLH